MSKLNDLITKLCPDGVQYRKLGEIEKDGLIKLGRGKVISKKDIANNPGTYPIYSASAMNNGKFGEYGDYMFDDIRLTWSIDGGGRFFYRDDEKYSVTNVCGWLKVIDENAFNPKFLFYVLTSQWSKLVFNYTIKAHPSVIRNTYDIPMVPLPVQSEIVRILDAFTELEAELEAELADRKKQYEYFRGRLLDDKNLERMDGEPVETKKLGDVSRVFGGYAFKSKEYTVSGARVMRISDVQAGYISNENAKYCPIDQPKQADSARLFANDLLVSLTGNVGRVAMVDNTVLPAYLNQRVAGLRATDAINYRFLFHYLNQHQFIADCERAGKGSAQKNLSMGYLTNYEIPVPSIATQKRVVDILDRFDALTTSLTDGIPAEIAMRREQYEYYRSRLLDFPRLPEDSDSDGNVE